MSRKRPKGSGQNFIKPVIVDEHEKLFKPFKIVGEQKNLSKPFKIVGDARPSKTGRSLSMRIKHSDGIIHYYTIAKVELERMFSISTIEEFEELIPASIREYFNVME